MKRLSLACVIAGLLVAAAPARAADPPLDLERLTVADAAARRWPPASSRASSSPAPTSTGSRPSTRAGRALNAVRIVNPRALTDASLLDLERATGKVRGPLHGVPVLVKDNLDVAGLPTTAGNVALQDSVPEKDSTVVAQLRAAGAVILGKTNLTEFANFMSTTGMPNGYSSLGGQVLNPYDLDYGTSGSSAGSGAAAAAGLAAITIGTETCGSIVSPVGDAEPRRAATDRRPGQPDGHPADLGHAGHGRPDDAHGRRRGGRAAGDRRRATRRTRRPPARPTAPDYLAGLTTTALQGKRIGVINNTDAQYVAAVAAVQALGATTVTVGTPSSSAPFDILTPEFKRDLNAYLGRLPASAPMKSLADIIAYNTAHADEAHEVRPGPAHAEPGHRPHDPGEQRHLHDRP